MVAAPGAGPERDNGLLRRFGRAQSEAAALQTRQRLHGLGRGFSAHRVAEDQARHAGRADSRTAGARSRAAAMSAPVSDVFLAIVNPAAGGGRCGKLAKAALEKLRAAGLELEVARDVQAGRSHGSGARCLRSAAGGILSRWAATARPTKSSTAFSRGLDGRAAHARLSAAGHGQFLPARFQRSRRRARRRSDSRRAAARLRRPAPEARIAASSTSPIC